MEPFHKPLSITHLFCTVAISQGMNFKMPPANPSLVYNIDIFLKGNLGSSDTHSDKHSVSSFVYTIIHCNSEIKLCCTPCVNT